MLKFKSGVKVNGIKPEILLAIAVANDIYKMWGVLDTVVTSVTDGVHSRGSLHYIGHAVDLRIYNFDEDEKLGVVNSLRDALTDEYDVVLEERHIHIEFQPKS